LARSKTQIVHLREGFNFLGFNVKHYRDSSTKTGWKVLIKPSRKSLQSTRQQIRQVWLDYQSCSVDFIIDKLNPIIRGIANYFRTVVSSQIFRTLDRWMFARERRYTKRLHPHKSQAWCKRRYFGRFNLEREDYWVFGNNRTGKHLLKFCWFNIKRHPPLKGAASPDDPELRSYWEHRRKTQSHSLTPSYQKLAQQQGYKCHVCGESLFNRESLQKHHKIPLHLGGKDSYANLELVHYYCHQQLHSPVQPQTADTENVPLW